MRRIERVPPAFRRLQEVGGVLDFALFADAGGGEDEALAAIGSALGELGPVDLAALRVLGGRRISRRAFLGEWADPVTGALIRVGTWTTDRGETLRDPRLDELAGVRIVSGSGPVPAVGAGGQFAYAFSEPPYPLQAGPGEVQALFDAVCGVIAPPRCEASVLDWSHERLPEVSPYFVGGAEWWGVFLFSVHVPALRRLTIIAGSATD